MSLSIRQLQIIHTVASFGSVTSAAQALGISQPAVSMMLRECSREAGFPMFLRKQGRLQPTAETRVLLIDLERVFDGIERIGRLIEDMSDTHVGSIQIAATATLANNILPAAIAEFQKSRPRIQISVKTTDVPSVIQSVVREEVDLGLALSPLAQHDARAIELCTADLVAVVCPTHPLAGLAMVEAGDLTPYPLISFSRSQPLGALVEQAFRQAGTPRRVAIEVNQSSVACALARAGAGVAVIDPFWLIEARENGVVCLKFAPGTAVTAQVLVSRGAPLSRPARLFLATMRRTIKSLQVQGLL
ncbi:LysR substrate-binding domain-containing protein [Tardiphaga sp.]|jgi:DNA-binding transcriptional LysR family regulator|uniref:LysR substrate-binding domain-containing protein n=1 Tax=Tardiphaga sp. TaxID=1926292 RepID=UPI0025E81E54|nr:LysR substrate-binding domain-containing protein [Tardiphaga sp.]